MHSQGKYFCVIVCNYISEGYFSAFRREMKDAYQRGCSKRLRIYLAEMSFLLQCYRALRLINFKAFENLWHYYSFRRN